jgi:hypothetical protein
VIVVDIGFDIAGFSVEYNEGFLESFEGELPTEYKPVIFHIDSDHAQYIEFGSQGRKDITFEKHSKNGTKSSKKSNVYEKIRAWVVARGAKGTDKELDQLAFAIFRKIATEGIPPQPFIRPAIHDIEREVDAGEFADENSTMETLATAFMERMIQYLEENHTIYDGGSIKDSISWEHVEFDDPRLDGGTLFGGIDIPEDVWENDYADLKGDVSRALERKRNLENLRW